MDAKPLTPAQRKALLEYSKAAAIAQANFDRFVSYLREEHDAPVSGWLLNDVNVGFVPKPAPPEAKS